MKNSPLSSGAQAHLGWVDALRVLACLLVVLAHCCDAFVARFDADRVSFLTGALTGSAVRPCVPLFAMMTGLLLLPTSEGLTAFYRKRIGRIMVPLVFWSLMLPVLFFTYYTFITPDSQNPLAALGEHQSPDALLTKFYAFLFNFNTDTVPLWYLYMLIGLYLIMPILSAWLRQATKKELQVVLGVWVLTLVAPYVQLVAPMLGYTGNNADFRLWGACVWNEFGMFHYVSGFTGYLLLAYYLKRFPPAWSWRRMLAVAIPMFVAGYAITAGGYVMLQAQYPGNYAYLEIVWYFCSINVLMMTLPVFLIIQKLNPAPRPWLRRLAQYSFGIYLCHFIWVYVTYDVFDTAALPYWARIAAMCVLTFALSAAVTGLLYALKLTRRLVA